MSLAPIDNRPLALKAYQRLLSEIIQGTRPAGTRISEESIAQEFGISRTPAREALMRLSAEGLVARIPRKGCQIAELDRDALKDRFECRAMLEALALDLAFEHLPKTRLEELREGFRKAKNADASLAADELLHELILTHCPNCSLVEIIRKLQQQCNAFRAFRAASRPVAPITRERLSIVEALLSGNKEAAKQRLSTHILGGIEQAVKLR